MQAALKATAALALIALLTGCNEPVYTLYRSSPYKRSLRLLWASFDAQDRPIPGQPHDINQVDCELTAKVLTANSEKVDGPMSARFWCEPGGYRP